MAITAGALLAPLHLESRGERIKTYAESFYAGLPVHVPERELAVVKQNMGWTDGQLVMRSIDRSQGPGNALLITLEYEHVTEVFTGFGQKGVTAESVAAGAVGQAQRYTASEATVSSFLADQLLLPMALAGGGSFVATDWSQHAATNADVIRRFLAIDIQTEKRISGEVWVRLRSKGSPN